MAKAKDNDNGRKLRLSLALDLRLLCGILFLIIAGMLFIWKPWNADTDKTIAVRGEALVEETPDEYQFSTSLSAEGTSTSEATQAVTTQGGVVVAKLVELGVSEELIKTDVYSFENGGVIGAAGVETPKSFRATYTVSFKLQDAAIAQAATNYLATAGVEGSVTPQVNFSEKLRKEIVLQAREAAATDAQTKAESQARILGVNVGDVISVADDTPGFVDITPLDSQSATEDGTGSSLTLRPGKQELRVSILVTFGIR